MTDVGHHTTLPFLRLNLACGPHLLDGFDNLDADTGWRFQDGLAYPDESVEGITESHGLLYLPLDDWPYVFSEFARVLKPDGVIRITEDATDDPLSERYGGWHEAVTLTSADLVHQHLRQAGFYSFEMTAEASLRPELELFQAWHGAAPKVFVVEGQKP